MIDPFTIKPLDKKTILENARATKGRIITVEDHYHEGELVPGGHSPHSCSPGIGSSQLFQTWERSMGPDAVIQLKQKRGVSLLYCCYDYKMTLRVESFLRYNGLIRAAFLINLALGALLYAWSKWSLDSFVPSEIVNFCCGAVILHTMFSEWLLPVSKSLIPGCLKSSGFGSFHHHSEINSSFCYKIADRGLWRARPLCILTGLFFCSFISPAYRPF